MSLCPVSIRDEGSQEETWMQLYRCAQSSTSPGQSALLSPAPRDLFCCISVAFQCTIPLWPWGSKTCLGQLMILPAPMQTLAKVEENQLCLTLFSFLLYQQQKCCSSNAEPCSPKVLERGILLHHLSCCVCLPTKILWKGQILRHIQGEFTPRARMLLNSRLPCMPEWMYFQNYFFQVLTLWHEMEHPIRKTFCRRASHCFPRNALWIFHHLCARCNDVSVLCWALHAAGLLSKNCWSTWQRKLHISLWDKVKGSPLLSSSHLTAQVGWADGCGHGSSTCCDGVTALNATPCVSGSLRYCLQGRMNVIEQVDVEYRVLWASSSWACLHTVEAQSTITSSVWCMVVKPAFLHLSWMRVHHPLLQKAMKTSTASQSKTGLTLPLKTRLKVPGRMRCK